ncbi:uncharacterized protein [Littorina saxatilis]|uniref:uncharacterized protein isoform X2 n=1 Tax=Littorina saxatilis TaxID=31220 RepID=UPI0038B60DF0
MRGKCWNCNEYGHRKAECPEIQCFKCKRFGHMARECTGYSSYRSPSPEDLSDCGDYGDYDEWEGQSRSPYSVGMRARGRSLSRGRASYPRPRSVSAQRELQQKETELRQKERELQEKERVLQQQNLEIQQKRIRMAREEKEEKKRKEEEEKMREEEENKKREEEKKKRKEAEEKKRKEEEDKNRKEREDKLRKEEAERIMKLREVNALRPAPKPVNIVISPRNMPDLPKSPSKIFSTLRKFWGSSETSPDASIASKSDVPSRTKNKERAEPLKSAIFQLSSLEYKVIEKFYLGELEEFVRTDNGTLNLNPTTKRMGYTGSIASKIQQEVSRFMEAIRENSGTWKLSTSPTFAKLPASQHALVVSGARVMGTETLSTTVETKLQVQFGVDAALNVTFVPPSRDLDDSVAVTCASITAVEQLRRSVHGKVAQITVSGHSAIRTKVPVGTKLPATSFILHAVLSTFQEGGHMEVKKIVTDCLTQAANEGLQKIAFPPLGVGRKFAYPVDAVAKDMVSATLDFVRKPTPVKRVIFATNDMSVASVFNREIWEQTAAMMEQPCPKGISFREITGDVEAVIFVKDKTTLPRAAGVLAATLQDSLLGEVTVCDAAEYHELTPGVTAVIQAVAAEKGVRLQEKRDDGGTMKLVALGTAENSQHIADLVKGKMYEGLRNKSRELSFVSPHSLPSYWQLNRAYGSIQEAMAGLDQRQKKFVMYDVDSTELREITNLMNRTWKHGVVGVGKDARNLGHTSIQIVQVCRLENPELWEKYSERKEKLLRRLKKSPRRRLAGLEEIAGNSGPVMTSSTIVSGSVLRREVSSEINEHYLFHGTKDECLVAIERDGLDGRFSKERPLLGRGVYAAESPTKSDQYTDPSKLERTGGPKTMLLVRMLLGEPHINTDRSPPKFSRPPCKGCLQLLCDCQHATHYDSVVDDAGRLFREFVVYEQCQCYPEYIITYKRV